MKFYSQNQLKQTKMPETLIEINNCRIENSNKILIETLSWKMKEGENWLVIGPNGGGKADFVNALAGSLKIIPNSPEPDQSSNPIFSNIFQPSTEIVSLERAAKIIQEERENDESDYLEGGVDHGRTGRFFIAQGLFNIKKGETLPAEAKNFEAYPAIKLCGVEKILDRGLKYMSTGEIRRTLLARALISGKKLLILSDPFAGLDKESRSILLDFFTNLSNRSVKNENMPHIILGMERWHEIPDSITNVLEFSDKKITFCGKRDEYEKLIEAGKSKNEEILQKNKENLSKELDFSPAENNSASSEILIQMNHVNVGWDENKVLVDLSWTLHKNEHWLIRGPNGSGKTTFLELITGDNKQVYCNDVHIFGIKRGSGETIWDIKKKLGIVSYRLHVEYRMLGSTSLQNVIISGFRDSIGLYGAATDSELASAKKWLKLGGFEGRETETFGNLSYGEQRAILILRSVVKKPEILILDEPCHGLDELQRQKILQLMELIAESGTTTLLHVTHDPSEILHCEKHILELHPGESPMYKIINS